MFELITEVPTPIAEFYKEEVRREPTGELVEETYTYLDEDGNEQTGTRMEPEYVDNIYVVQLPVPQSVSWVKVNTLIEQHQGKRDSVIEAFSLLATETEKWAFHDTYLTWFLRPIPERARDETGSYIGDDVETDVNEAWVDGYTPEMHTSEPEPVYIESGEANLAKIHNARFKRDTGRYAPITVQGFTFDADAKAYENIQGTVANWDVLVNDAQLREIGITDGSRMYWTLADNSHEWVNKAALQEVLGAVSVRAGLLHAEYIGAKG